MPSLESMAREAEKVLRQLAEESADRAAEDKRKRKARQPQLAQAERNTAVLFGLYHGWSNALIAKRFHISKNTVILARKRMADSPQSLFRIPILHRDVVNNKQVWRCEVCGSRMLGTERKARLHVANHFGISREAYKRNGILDEDRTDYDTLVDE